MREVSPQVRQMFAASVVAEVVPIERYRIAKGEAKREATLAQVAALSAATHAMELLRALGQYDREDLTVCVQNDAPLLADQINAFVQRMGASLGNGRIR